MTTLLYNNTLLLLTRSNPYHEPAGSPDGGQFAKAPSFSPGDRIYNPRSPGLKTGTFVKITKDGYVQVVPDVVSTTKKELWIAAAPIAERPSSPSSTQPPKEQPKPQPKPASDTAKPTPPVAKPAVPATAPVESTSDINDIKTTAFTQKDVAATDRRWNEQPSGDGRLHYANKDSYDLKQEAAQRVANKLTNDPDFQAFVEYAWTNDSAMKVSKRPPSLKEAQKTVVHDVLIDNWAAGSGYRFMQDAAAAEFGLPKPTFKDGGVYDQNYLKAPPAVHRGVQKVLRAQYDFTQSELKKRNIGSVVLFRGISLDKPGTGVPSTVNLHTRPLSSFSTNTEIAKGFSSSKKDAYGGVIAGRVPAKNIFSWALTGLGEPNESEIVVVGSNFKGVGIFEKRPGVGINSAGISSLTKTAATIRSLRLIPETGSLVLRNRHLSDKKAPDSDNSTSPLWGLAEAVVTRHLQGKHNQKTHGSGGDAVNATTSPPASYTSVSDVQIGDKVNAKAGYSGTIIGKHKSGVNTYVVKDTEGKTHYPSWKTLSPTGETAPVAKKQVSSQPKPAAPSPAPTPTPKPVTTASSSFVAYNSIDDVKIGDKVSTQGYSGVITGKHKSGKNTFLVKDEDGKTHYPSWKTLKHEGAGGSTTITSTPKPPVQAPSSKPYQPPEQAYFNKVKKVGGAQGSNPGGVYEGADGRRFYAKFYSNSLQGYSEIAAQSVYEAAGINTTKSFMMKIDGKNAVVSEMIAGQKFHSPAGVRAHLLNNPETAAGLFAASVVTQNWDVIGLSGDNVMLHNGKLTVIDTGGSFLFRAQGGTKKYTEGADEFTSLLNPSINSASAMAFSGSILEQPAVARLTINKIDNIVLASGNIHAPGVSQDMLVHKAADLRVKLLPFANHGQSVSVKPVAPGKEVAGLKDFKTKSWSVTEADTLSPLHTKLGYENDNSSYLRREVAYKLADQLQNDPTFQQFVKAHTIANGGSPDAKKAVHYALDDWASSSTTPSASLMHRAVMEEFNLKGAATPPPITASAYHSQEALQGARVLARTMYNNTQAELAAKGIKELVLYRGSDGLGALPKEGVGVAKFRPISSFSTNPRKATGFGGHGKDSRFVAVRVPAEHIFSFYGTGFGTLYEDEFVVLGGTKTVASMAKGQMASTLHYFEKMSSISSGLLPN